MSIKVSDIEVINPWDYETGKWSTKDWDDNIGVIGHVDTTRPDVEDIDSILHQGVSGDEWDGIAVFVAKLKDGRYIAYESFWGSTGHGFSRDAYGGDATVWFANEEDLNALILTALTNEGRSLVGIPREGLDGRTT